MIIRQLGCSIYTFSLQRQSRSNLIHINLGVIEAVKDQRQQFHTGKVPTLQPATG